MSGKRLAVIGVTVVLLVVAGAAAAVGPWRDAGPTDTAAAAVTTPVQQVAQDAMLPARTKGDSSALMTLYEVGDFQCSACRIFFDSTLPQLLDEYVVPGKLRIIFINFPIYQLHPNAPAAHEFALCAASQDRFWPVHDLLYRNQDRWASLDDPSAYFFQLADSARLRADSLAACLASGQMRALLASEAQGAFNAGIRSTPSFVLEGSVIRGAAPIDVWRPILDSVYAAKTGRSNRPRP